MKRAEPVTVAFCTKPSKLRAVTVFPEPDSPTMPTVSPACTATWAFCKAAVARASDQPAGRCSPCTASPAIAMRARAAAPWSSTSSKSSGQKTRTMVAHEPAGTTTVVSLPARSSAAAIRITVSTVRRSLAVGDRSAALIITEATQISFQAKGYSGSPGIHSAEQIAAWKHINQGIHAEGGHSAVQVWHTGRVSHTSLQPGGEAPVAPSALPADARTTLRDAQGNLTRVETSAPRLVPVCWLWLLQLRLRRKVGSPHRRLLQ